MPTIADFLTRNARRMPERPALVWGNRARGWAKLDERINRLANALRDRGGQRPGGARRNRARHLPRMGGDPVRLCPHRRCPGADHAEFRRPRDRERDKRLQDTLLGLQRLRRDPSFRAGLFNAAQRDRQDRQACSARPCGPAALRAGRCCVREIAGIPPDLAKIIDRIKCRMIRQSGKKL